ncbi:retrotransposon protein, putative, ty1-copia subclass [Tanacetum coccineum]
MYLTPQLKRGEFSLRAYPSRAGASLDYMRFSFLQAGKRAVCQLLRFENEELYRQSRAFGAPRDTWPCINELHAMLKLHEQTLPKNNAPALHDIRAAELLKKKKNAASGAGGSGIFTIELNTFLNRSWIYDTGCGTHICNTTHGLRASRKLKPGAFSLYVGNGQREAVEAISIFYLCLPSGLEIVLNNCHYDPSITRGVISVSRLYEDGFINRFVNNTIQVSRNNMVYFSAIPRDGIFEFDLSNSYANESSIYTVSNKRAMVDLESTVSWHCRLGYISKKLIKKLQHDGLLNSTDLRAFEKCVPCMSGKMARKPYTHQVERAKDLLGLIHTDVYGPFKIMSRQGASYFVTFTNDFSRYGYVYLLKHKHEVFETTKYFKTGISENQPRIVLITQKRKLEDLEIIQEEDTHPSIDTSLNHEEDDLEIDEPQSDIIPIRRSTRTRRPTDRMCLYINAEEHELGDLGEPANYKAALLDPESDKWLNAMNVEMQSMKDNEVWDLVDLPPNGKTVGNKWLFKKKTDMDAVIHTYKARLVAKGYTQTLGINYEETFSPVAYIRAIMIFIAIAAFYDYEIWQMAVKTAFLNGYLSEEVYMEQPEGEAAYILRIKIYRDRSQWLIGLCQSAYIKKILKRYHMENSKRRSIPMQEKLRLSKSEGASTPAELKRMQNVPYASAVGSIMYAGGDLKRELRVSCYTDVGYLTDADDLKSQIGYVFILNGGAVDWKSAKQSIFATLSAKTEYIAAYDASKEAVCVRKLIYGLGVSTIKEPISMYYDNTGAITIANESGITKGARNFRAKVHYLREVIKFGDIKLEQVYTDDNLADPFIKALTFLKHSEHTRNIGMLTASSLM